MSRARDLADLGGSADAGGITGRNLIINGAMQVWQRGTSVDSIASTTYQCDRWRIAYAGLDGNVDIDQDTSVPTGQGFGYSQKVSMDASESSLDADDQLNVTHRFEAQNLQHLEFGTSSAKSLVVSFWVKSSVAATYSLEWQAKDGTQRMIGRTYTINSANTWEYKTLTVPGDVSATIDNDNGAGLDLRFWLDAGSTYTSGTFATDWENSTDANRVSATTGWLVSSNPTWHITGVQLEVGETATPFEHEDYGTTLRKCQRYYYKIGPSDAGGIGSGIHNTTTQATVFIPYQVEMREGPSAVETSSTASNFDVRNNNSIIQLSSTPSFQAATKHGAEVLCNHGGTSTQGEATILRVRTANDYIAWSAEL